jgi:hypothetical protein
MATNTATETVEPDSNHRQRALRALQHLGAIALLASFIVTYAIFAIVANEVLAPVLDQTPLWFTTLLETASGTPIVVVLVLASNYALSLVVEEDTTDAWRLACYAAAVGAVALPVMDLLLPSAGVFV